ncbi:hypothetical protein VSR34_35175 [Paraburkholderia sp. JHI2823]|uniref:hypothetical protein n=1 Tax=Paraburkholderia sp. JHI2823 TaxID=3112960 RepID=UPI000485540E|nr:hypothetical protein [Paraburkholderia mimosarum]
MKMETHIAAARDCTIAALRVQAGDSRQPRSWRSVARWALTKAWHVRFRLDFRRLTSRPTLRRSFTIEALAIHRGPTFLNEGSA